jgi:hypothetical protein
MQDIRVEINPGFPGQKEYLTGKGIFSPANFTWI